MGELTISLLTQAILMRKWSLGLPIIAGMAMSGISPASAMVVSTGSQIFEVDSFKVVGNQPFEIAWSKVVNDTGDTITGVAAFGNFVFDGTGLAVQTGFHKGDICGYSGNQCGASNDIPGPFDLSDLPPDRHSSSGFPVETTKLDFETETVDYGIAPSPAISEPASLAILGSALFLFGWLRRRPPSGGCPAT